MAEDELRMLELGVVHTDASKNRAGDLNEWRLGQTGRCGPQKREATLWLQPRSHEGTCAKWPELPIFKSD